MVLTSRLPLASLIEFCRVLRHNLAAGLSIRQVFQQQARRGPLAVRPVASRIAQELEQGESLEEALKPEKDAFPPMFVSLAIVGEQSGALPEVLAELERYFLLLQKLRRDFLTQITWPAIQFFLAPFVIAFMIFLLAVLSPSTGKPYDPLGMGFTGVGGAIRFLVEFFGSLALLVVVYLVLTRTLKHKAQVDRLLLRLPAVGPCLSAIALMRFSVALRLTMESAMSIGQAVRLSMRATGNAAFEEATESVRGSLKKGDELALSLRCAGVFPEDFIDILANAEEGGRISEVLEHQAEHYEEEARRRLTILTRTASGLVYAGVAGMIIFMIFRLATTVFGAGGPYDPASYGL